MARSFAGGTDHVYWTWPPASSSTKTIAFWLRTTQATQNAVPCSIGNAQSENGPVVILNNSVANDGKITIQGKDSGGTQRLLVSGSGSVNNGAARHVAVTCNQTNGQATIIYIDGAQDATANSSANWNSGGTNFDLQLGDTVDAFWPSFVGDIWDVGFWTAILTADEIASLAKGFSPKLIRPSSLAIYAPLVSDVHDIRNSSVSAVTGTSVSAHGRTVGGAV